MFYFIFYLKFSQQITGEMIVIKIKTSHTDKAVV